MSEEFTKAQAMLNEMLANGMLLPYKYGDLMKRVIEEGPESILHTSGIVLLTYDVPVLTVYYQGSGKLLAILTLSEDIVLHIQYTKNDLPVVYGHDRYEHIAYTGLLLLYYTRLGYRHHIERAIRKFETNHIVRNI